MTDDNLLTNGGSRAGESTSLEPAKEAQAVEANEEASPSQVSTPSEPEAASHLHVQVSFYTSRPDPFSLGCALYTLSILPFLYLETYYTDESHGFMPRKLPVQLSPPNAMLTGGT